MQSDKVMTFGLHVGTDVAFIVDILEKTYRLHSVVNCVDEILYIMYFKVHIAMSSIKNYISSAVP